MRPIPHAQAANSLKNEALRLYLGFLVFFCVIECFGGEEECRLYLPATSGDVKPPLDLVV
jgi:hypothetical protein